MNKDDQDHPLRKMEESLKEAQRIAHIGNWDLDILQNKLTWSDEIYRIFEIDREKFEDPYDAFLEAIHPEDHDLVDKAYADSLKNHQPYDIVHRLLMKDGRIKYVHEKCETYYDNDGKPVRSIGTVQDITEHKKAEEQLAKYRDQLEALVKERTAELHETEDELTRFFDLVPDMLCIASNDGYFKKVNGAWEKTLGFTKSELLSKPFSEFIHPDDREPTFKEVERQLAGSGTAHFVNRYLCKDGTYRWLEWQATPSVGNLLFATARDITERLLMEEERRKLDQERQKTERLESLGMLAGGIAHDFNNLLSGIYGYIELAILKSRDEQMTAYLSKTLNTVQRAKGLAGQLLTFSKGGAPVMSVASLSPFIQDTADFALSGSKVSCRFEIPPDLWHCNYDKTQLAQAIENIVINAKHAMPEGGQMVVSAANVALKENQVAALPEGKYVRISIMDTGIGIPGDVLPRIFDPFFSTKLQGSGLGLATSFSIVKRHGGLITVETEESKGSVFHIYLPASMEPPATARQSPRPTEQKESGRVLIMDDEKAMCEIVEELLDTYGYTAVSTFDGKEALSLFVKETAAGRPFSAVILDLTVPGGMGGREIIDDIRRADPAVPVFAMSGYSNDPLMADPRKYGFDAAISKPFMVADLLAILQEYLKKEHQ